jgi:hypothetical protein
MALPSQATEKLMQAPSGTQGIFKQFVLFAVAIFVLMLVLYGGIEFGYKSYLNRAIATKKAQIDSFSAQVPVDDQARVANFYSQLQNLQQLLGAHTTVSPVLSLLENTTLPNIYYIKLSVNATANEADVTGAARNLGDIAQQAASLEADSSVVDHVNFANAGSSQGGLWQFTMNIFLKPGVLHNGNPTPVTQQQSFQPDLNSSTSQAVATSSATSSNSHGSIPISH